MTIFRPTSFLPRIVYGDLESAPCYNKVRANSSPLVLYAARHAMYDLVRLAGFRHDFGPPRMNTTAKLEVVTGTSTTLS